MSTLGEDLLKASVPFVYATGHTSDSKVSAKKCCKPGCTQNRHVTLSGLIKSWCLEHCRQHDRESRGKHAKAKK